MSQSFQLDHNGAQLAGVSSGQGQPLVFLHAGVADKRMWQEQIEALGGTRLAIAYDRRGFGETRCGDEAFSHVDDLGAVLDACGLDSAVLIGCSQGGRIAIDFALAHPERVTALVLIAAAISGAPKHEPLPPDVQKKVAALEAAEAGGDVERVNAIEANLWLDGPTMPERRISGAPRALLLDMNGIALNHPEVNQEKEPPSAYDRLGELKLPALVIWGDLDFEDMQGKARHLLQSIPGAEGVKLEGVAHLPSLEQPDRLNDLISGFLDRSL